jgi:hypothetical protein
MNTYKVTYVEIDATTTSAQQIAVDSVAADEYEVGKDFVIFIDDNHNTVASYATKRVVSIMTEPSGAPAS